MVGGLPLYLMEILKRGPIWIPMNPFRTGSKVSEHLARAVGVECFFTGRCGPKGVGTNLSRAADAIQPRDSRMMTDRVGDQVGGLAGRLASIRDAAATLIDLM